MYVVMCATIGDVNFFEHSKWHNKYEENVDIKMGKVLSLSAKIHPRCTYGYMIYARKQTCQKLHYSKGIFSVWNVKK